MMKTESPIVGMIRKVEKKRNRLAVKLRECDSEIMALLKAHQMAQLDKIKEIEQRP